MSQQISKPPRKIRGVPKGLTYFKNGGAASSKSKGSKICPAGKAWAQRTFDTYPSAYANKSNKQKVKKVIKGLKKASKTHAGQANTLKKIVRSPVRGRKK